MRHSLGPSRASSKNKLNRLTSTEWRPGLSESPFVCTLSAAEEETLVVSDSATAGSRLLGPALCILVLLIMIVAVIYTAWISLSNYSSIGV